MPNDISSLERMTSHVGRDLLNETKAFSNEGKAVGEYVRIVGNIQVTIQQLRF